MPAPVPESRTQRRERNPVIKSDRWRNTAALIAGVIPLGMAWLADPGGIKLVERIYVWSFTVFAVGLAELFVLFVGLTVLGKIDLPRVFADKDPSTDTDKEESISLSRLQAFMWTLVIMTTYFYEATKGNGLPIIPPELLTVMGISGAVYLASKQMSKS